MQQGLLLLIGLGIHHRPITEHLLSTTDKLHFPSGDLGGVQLVTLGQLAQCLALLNSIQHYPGLERGGVLAVIFLRGHGLAKSRSSPVLISPTTSV